MTMTTPCARCGQAHPGCTGHSKTNEGAPCRRPCKPGEVCPTHGGMAPQVKAARARREAEAEAARQVATLGLPVDISPTEALLQEVQWTAGHVQWLRAKVAELDEQITGQHALVWGVTAEGEKHSVEKGLETTTTSSSGPSVWYELYAKERQHLVTVCSAALKAGVEERRVRLAESQGDLVATAIRRILDALGLTPDQQALVATVVPRELRLIAGGAA